MQVEKKQIGTHFTRALFDITTVNKDARTVDVVFATETPVLRRDWELGLYNEILVCQPGNVRMERLNNGAAVLDNHDASSVTTQLGVVEAAKIQSGEGRATLRFSKRDDVEKVWQDVQDGILRGVSVRYNIYKAEITEEQNKTPDLRATDWEPLEISLAPVPADYNSGLRSAENQHEVIIINHKNSTTMNTAEQRSADIFTACRAAKLPDAFAQSLVDDANVTVDSARAAIIAELGKTPAAAPAASAPAADPKAANTRASQILSACRAANLGLEFAQSLIDDESVTVDGARAAVLNKLAEGQPPAQRSANPATIIPGKDETDKRRTGLSNAILHRVDPSAVKATDAGEYRGMSLVDISRECLTAQNVNVRGLTPRETAMAAFGMGERALSTSDFPLILGNTINRSLRQAYQLADRTFLPFCRQANVNDFREVSRIQLSDFTALAEVKEGGEYTMGNVSETTEKWKVAKYGKIIPITWETIVNDDLAAFGRIPQAMAASAAQKQSDIVYGILTANANLSDSVALFSTAATRKNLAASGGAIDITTLSAARAAMRKQAAPKGSPLNISPKYLVVGPDSELTAFQYTSPNYTPNTAGTQNPFAGVLTTIVDSRLTGNQWYLIAAPTNIDTIEYGFLDGEELFIENEMGFGIDGMKTKVRMVFGAKAIDFRGMYKNAGA